MSASEKLKAMGEEGFVAHGPNFWILLPQIVAVVEAAEAVKFWNREPWTDEFKAIESSMAALEEALS